MHFCKTMVAFWASGASTIKCTPLKQQELGASSASLPLTHPPVPIFAFISCLWYCRNVQQASCTFQTSLLLVVFQLSVKAEEVLRPDILCFARLLAIMSPQRCMDTSATLLVTVSVCCMTRLAKE